MSMPYLGLTPFLPEKFKMRCSGVSMPYLGLTSFLRIERRWELCGKMCQCPISGSRHFYHSDARGGKTQRNVSMPYLGLTSFLQRRRCKRGRCKKTVSMPYLGLTSFLQLIIIRKKNDFMCQCPISGSRHFYWQATLFLALTILCVNALSRAHVISTNRNWGGPLHRNPCQCPISGSRHFYWFVRMRKLFS